MASRQARLCLFAWILSSTQRCCALHRKPPANSAVSGASSLARSGKQWPSTYFNDSSTPKEKLFACGANPPVDSGSDLDMRCPESCPLLAEKRGNAVPCDFHCVEDSVAACAAMDDRATVPDEELKICRRCVVRGCSQCVFDGTDTCAKCSAGYTLRDGRCVSHLRFGWFLFGLVLICIAAIVVLWVVDLAMRPITNEKRLHHALDLRSRAKLRQPKHTMAECDGGHRRESTRDLWPLSTNLCKEGQVAGPGLVLSFNFQVAIVLWAVVLGIAWASLGIFVDTDLFRMGTRRWDSARQQCVVIAWGFETQHRLMWAKVAFLAFAYVFTFLGALLFGIRQRRIFQRMDMHMTTHKDFSAVASGLTDFSGDRKLEEELKEFFEKETRKEVVFASVSWIFEGQEDEFMDIVDADMLMMHQVWVKKQEKQGPSICSGEADGEGTVTSALSDEDEADGEKSASDSAPAAEYDAREFEDVANRAATNAESSRMQLTFTRIMRSVESVFLSTPIQKALTRGRAKGFEKRHRERREEDDDFRRSEQRKAAGADGVASKGLDHNASVKEELEALKSSGKAFVVFNTEQDRDDAVEEWQRRADKPEFEGRKVQLKIVEAEPESVRWRNFGDEREPFGLTKKVLVGISQIMVGLAVWAGVFYLPFVWISASSSYTYGSAPSDLSTFVFGMIVVLGNAIMYTICSEVTDRMRFPFAKDHEVCYMMFYTVSCTFNVILDLVITAMVAYWSLSGLGARMHDGHPLSDSGSHVQLLTTYGMQRELGENTKAYAWPSTFLIPFLIEPVTIYLPYQLMVLLVRTHSDIHSSSAEAYLASIPFDLSRYADIHLNVILAVLILFFPGGYNLEIFFGLALAGVWIYSYDHVRVLRFCPSFSYASMVVDWWSQWMMCFPCAMLLAAFFWKINQDMQYALSTAVFGRLGDPNHSSIGIAAMMVYLFLGHVVVHTLLLAFVVPLFGIKQEGERSTETYKQCAERLPCSWITSNPIYCLRSDYIYCHNPPVVHCVPGKEHLMVLNREAGQFFEDVKVTAEDFNSWNNSAAQALSAVRDRVKEDLSFVKGRISPRLVSPRAGASPSAASSGDTSGSKDAEQPGAK